MFAAMYAMQCSGSRTLHLPAVTSCVIDPVGTESCDRSLSFELPLSPSSQLMYDSEPLQDQCNQLVYDTEPSTLQVRIVFSRKFNY